MTTELKDAPGESSSEKVDVENIDPERKHLETLLQNRINFNLLFASVFLAGVSRIDELSRLLSLIVGTVISLLIALAIYRTHLLVRAALKDLEKQIPNHPYIEYRKAIFDDPKATCRPPNANSLLVVVPFILTGLFLILTIIEVAKWWPPPN